MQPIKKLLQGKQNPNPNIKKLRSWLISNSVWWHAKLTVQIFLYRIVILVRHLIPEKKYCGVRYLHTHINDPQTQFVNIKSQAKETQES